MPMPTAAIPNPIARPLLARTVWPKAKPSNHGRSVAASSATLAQQRTQHHSGKAEIECRCHRITMRWTKAFASCPRSSALNKACTSRQPAKHKSPATRAASIRWTEGLAVRRARTHPRCRRHAAETTAANAGKGPDNQEHDPARRVADPRHPFKIWAAAWSLPLSDLIAQKLNPIATVRVPAVAPQQHVRRVGLLASCIAFGSGTRR